MDAVTVAMDAERDTKNTRRFAEVEANGATATPDGAEYLLGTLYVPKSTLDLLGNPQSIEVTIKAA